jgi:hypothetical protein
MVYANTVSVYPSARNLATTPPPPSLSDRHRRELETASGVSSDVVAQRGYRTVSDPDELIRLGFAPSQARAGLLIPQFTTAGVQRGYMLKPDVPRTDARGKPIKYEAVAGSSPMIDVPPAMAARLRDPGETLYVSEGSKKADSLASRGLLCISLNGVYGFLHKKVVISDLDDIALIGRDVRLIFDSDITTKAEVADALDRLAGACWRRGAKVYVVTLPPRPDGAKCGIDDFLASGGTVADLDTLTTPWRAADPPPFATADAEAFARLTAERDQLVRDNAALLRVQANPHIKGGEKTMLAALLIVASNKPGAAPGTTVQLSANEIANDWRKEPVKGEHLAPFNRDGSRPRMARAQVGATLKAAMERGLLTVKPQPARVAPKDGVPFDRTEWRFTLPESVADFMRPAAIFQPPEPAPRKPRRLTSCGHCGEIQPIERTDVCVGCGAIRSREIIEPSAEERTLDKLSRVTSRGPGEGPSLGTLDNLSRVPDEPDWLVNAPDPEEEQPTTSPASVNRADIDRRQAAAGAKSPLVSAVRATDPAAVHRALSDLGAALAPIGDATGRAVPKPAASPGPRIWVCVGCHIPRSCDDRPCPTCGACGGRWYSPLGSAQDARDATIAAASAHDPAGGAFAPIALETHRTPRHAKTASEGRYHP